VPTIQELFDLSGKVALVTGGSRGLGKEMAEGLAEAGASLMLLARREQWLTPTVEERRTADTNVRARCAMSQNGHARFNRSDPRDHGKIDILVNNWRTWGQRIEEHLLANGTWRSRST
jgi:gluconate 5-dehydrogenase